MASADLLDKAAPPPPLPGQAPAPSLLTAPILPALLRFALPTMLAMLAKALATVAETAYVGSFGVASLAGMALVFPMVMLQMMLSSGAMGGGVGIRLSPCGVFNGAGAHAGVDEQYLALAEQALASGRADLIAMGRPFLANPDLVARLRQDSPLNAPDPQTFYTPGEKGCTNYPALHA